MPKLNVGDPVRYLQDGVIDRTYYGLAAVVDTDYKSKVSKDWTVLVLFQEDSEGGLGSESEFVKCSQDGSIVVGDIVWRRDASYRIVDFKDQGETVFLEHLDGNNIFPEDYLVDLDLWVIPIYTANVEGWLENYPQHNMETNNG